MLNIQAVSAAKRFALPWFVSTVLCGLVVSAPPLHAESVLTVGMTAGDIPLTTGNPDQGFEGFRFVGYNLYDALANWDLSCSRAVGYQAGPRHVVGCRSQQPSALDLSSARGREMARRLPVHRR